MVCRYKRYKDPRPCEKCTEHQLAGACALLCSNDLSRGWPEIQTSAEALYGKGTPGHHMTLSATEEKIIVEHLPSLVLLIEDSLFHQQRFSCVFRPIINQWDAGYTASKTATYQLNEKHLFFAIYELKLSQQQC
ncbi:hypothetical protein PoB_001917900 [Plakobranchus ocellatus]|uniref:Uncharacterized protein n=1 Tax=Plakobranchus ocellatus TaxID=259542 RepID=A0AAV3ZE45_9GAST|nr:hypothetical protein PoB_001917900 [Plakobranchus ocellatus]